MQCEFNRTKSAIINKISKIKRKYDYKFLEKQNLIIADSFKSKDYGKSLEVRISEILSSNPLSFEQILKSQKVIRTEYKVAENIGNILYDLLTN